MKRNAYAKEIASPCNGLNWDRLASLWGRRKSDLHPIMQAMEETDRHIAALDSMSGSKRGADGSEPLTITSID